MSRPGHLGSVAGLVLLAGTIGSQAALPPSAQRQAELRAIVDSPEVRMKLEGRVITEISAAGVDRYLIRAGECAMTVAIEDDPSGGAERRPGPRRFRVIAGKLTCR